jgi:hypothetical protein
LFLHNFKTPPAGTFQRGAWTADKNVAIRKESLGDPFVEGQYASFYTPELESLGRAITDAGFGAWSYNCDQRGPGLASSLFKQSKAAVTLRKADDGYRQSVGGFVVAWAEAPSGQRGTVVATFGKGRDYETHGSVLAVAACLVGHQAAYPGVHYFWEAFNRPNVVEWLKSADVRISESFT